MVSTIIDDYTLTHKWKLGPWKTTVLYKQVFHFHVSESKCSIFDLVSLLINQFAFDGDQTGLSVEEEQPLHYGFRR